MRDTIHKDRKPTPARPAAEERPAEREPDWREQNFDGKEEAMTATDVIYLGLVAAGFVSLIATFP